MEMLVDYKLDGGVATVTMDDGKANVMSVQMLQALSAAFDRAQADQAAVLLTGRPGMFSGGFDLAVFKRGPEEQFRMLELGALLTERLLSFPLPVVVACTGHDVRVGVDEGARIQVNEVQIGLTLPWFAIEVCRQRLSPAHLNIAAATAEPYSPQQAVVAGFLDEIVPAETLARVARDRATRLLTLHAEAFTATRLRLRRTALEALREAIRQDTLDWASRISKV